MSELTNTKLGAIGKVSMCKRILKNQTSSIGDIPFYKISTFGGKADCYISEELFEEYKQKYSYPKIGDILISAAGTIGRTVIYDGEKAFFQDSNIVWIDNDESQVLNDFLFYFYQLKPWRKTTGSTIDRLYNDNIREIDISFPTDKKEQKRVVEVLKSIDSKISNNNRINAELESMAKTIYDYWFTQFDFPDENGKPYKSSGGKMVWNEELKREIPEGWKRVLLKDIENNIVTGKTPSTKCPEYYNGDIPFITIGDIRGNTYIVSTEQHLSKVGADTQLKKYIPNDSLCVSCIASPGLIGFATTDSQTNQQINSIIFSDEKNKFFLYFALNDFFANSVGAKTGNTFDNMNKEEFSNIAMIFSSDIVSSFHKKVKPIFDLIRKNLVENQQLSSLRDWLLPMLMNGQVGFEGVE